MMHTFKESLLQITRPSVQPTLVAEVLIAIPRIACGAMLTLGFGSDKFGLPWSSGEIDLALFQVAPWFIEDVANFGGLFATFPAFFAWMGAGSEAVGGLLLALGLQTRISSLLIACTMLVAIFFQKWGGPLWHMLPAMGFLWVSMVGIAVGSGRIGLDYILTSNKKSKEAKQK